jgi:hypothetical protein
MVRRSVLVVAALTAALPVRAGELRPEEAKHFIAGKHFSYSCFDGTTGGGRIDADGSVAGTIQVRGSAAARFVTLPPGTIRVQASSICASLRGIPFQPCFAVNQTSATTFRGSIAGFGFAYCDFTRRNPRLEISARPSQNEDQTAMRTSIEE